MESNVKRNAENFTLEQNAEVLKKYSSKIRIEKMKYEKLLDEMSHNCDLAALIHENPKLNILRWYKSKGKDVDLSKIIRTDKGRLPKNYMYAGKTFYANPVLNPKLEKRVIANGGKVKLNNFTYSRDFLIKLDRKYPNGVPFGENGLPDFSNVAKKYPNGTLIIEEIKGGLTKNSNKDRILATNQLEAKGVEWDHGQYTWHHIPGTNKLILVDWYYHALCKHSGGRAISSI